MSRNELVNPEGLRVDGRRPPELRRIKCETGIFAQADGSAYVEQGNTKCLAAVYGPREPQHRQYQQHDRATINVEFNVASFSTGERKQQQRRDRRIMDIQTTIKQTFEAVVMITNFPRSEIDIYLQILQTDGGAVHTAINAATLALIDAGIPMDDYVCACSAGFANETVILDLNYLEESTDIPSLTVALLPKSGKVIMVSMENRMHLDHLEAVQQLASDGCTQLFDVLDETTRKKAKSLAKSALVSNGFNGTYRRFGAAITIIVGQLPKLLGIQRVHTTAPTYLVFGNTLTRIPTIARRIHIVFGPHPGLVKDVPSGLKRLGGVTPLFNNPALFTRAAQAAITVTLIGVLEHIEVCKSYGRLNSYTPNTNQELVALGLTNLFGAFLRAFPGTGSFSRSAIYSQSSVRSPLAAVFTIFIVVMAILFLTPVFLWIPDATLGAVVAAAIADLVSRPGDVRSNPRLTPNPPYFKS
ncbi:Exosome complex component RRP41 [Quaeritorhiza haematococci]|nr:Exosome complex component RRP41 [Quaeritorhiza haematococci]